MKARWHKRGTGLVWMFLLLWSVACQKVELPTEEPEGTEQPNGGNGSQTTPGADENPLPEEVDVPTVSDIFSIYDGVDLEADYETWVAGYIVGSCTGTTISSASFSSEKASNSNILIADAPGVTDVDVCMPVELEKGSHLRDDLNLSDNQIAGDHYDFKSPRVPVCSSEALGYYSHHGLCVYSYKDLRARLKKDSQIGISPMLIHFSYHIPSGDYLKDAQRAFSEEQISGKYELYYHPILKNLAVKKLF